MLTRVSELWKQRKTFFVLRKPGVLCMETHPVASNDIFQHKSVSVGSTKVLHLEMIPAALQTVLFCTEVDGIGRVRLQPLPIHVFAHGMLPDIHEGSFDSVTSSCLQ